MPKWEYLELRIRGHNDTLDDANNMLVTTSDGRYKATRMPTNPLAILQELGAQGWELIQSERAGVTGVTSVHALFKRPLLEG